MKRTSASSMIVSVPMLVGVAVTSTWATDPAMPMCAMYLWRVYRLEVTARGRE